MSTELEEKQAAPESAEEQIKIPETLPVLPLRDIVIYPFMIVPLFVSREKSIRAVDEALGENRMILLASQKDLDKEEPGAGRSLRSRHGRGHHAHAEAARRPHSHPGPGRSRARRSNRSMTAANTCARASSVMQEVLPPERSLEVEALMRNVRAFDGKGRRPRQEHLARSDGDHREPRRRRPPGRSLRFESRTESRRRAVGARHRRHDRAPAPRQRLLNKEIEVLTVQQEINTQARADIDRSQREFYLRQQLKAIQSELGEGNELAEEIAQYREKIEAAKMPKPAEEEALRQLKKLERMHPDAAETATLRNWLEIMTDLPWSKASKDNLDLKKAEQILERRSLRPGESQGTHHRSAGRSQAEGEAERVRSCVSSARRASARRRSVVRSRARSIASSCACRSAVCTTKPRFAAIAEPTSARCRAASFRRSSRPARTIR